MISAPRPRHRSSEHTTSSRPPVHSPPGVNSGNRLLSLLRHDLPASLVVLLTAVPLSLGIAAASGAPLMAGLIAAVVGGVVAGSLSGSPLQISGAATGLTVIVAGLVQQYGFAATAGITVAAGLLQLLLGLSRIGRAALSLSPAVVHGLLAGIGVVIAISQLHVVLGGQPQTSVLANLRDLPAQLAAHHDAAFLIGLIAIAVLLLWPRLPKVRLVPAALVAVALATAVAWIFRLDLPRVDLPEQPLAAFTLPVLPEGTPSGIALSVLLVAAVASVESLLSAVAVDRLHTGPRADLDRELVAQGVANMASGALGGLPIAGGIVRSSTNVAAGARSRASTILHGLWVAAFVLLLAGLLERIPLAALAAVLVVSGVQLVRLSHMRELWRHREFPVYAVTFAGVVFLDLVQGVTLGILLALALSLYRLTHATIRVNPPAEGEDTWSVSVRGSLVFLGVARLTGELHRVPERTKVLLNLHVDYLDHAAYEAIHGWCRTHERLGGAVTVSEDHGDTWFHRDRHSRAEQRRSLPGPLLRWFAPWSVWQHRDGDSAAAALIPRPRAEAGALDDSMLLGVHEFERSCAPLARPFFAELANGQSPRQLFVTCADSRVVPNLITTSGPGDLFTLRNIGNLVPRHDEGPADASVGATVEYAVDVLKVAAIVVCGHSDCGAMKAGLSGAVRTGSRLAEWLRHIQPSLIRFHAVEEDTGLAAHDRLSVANVVQQLDNLMTFPVVREAVLAGRLNLVGMFFDIAGPRVYLVDQQTGRLAPVTSGAAT
ncbi:SulP family inorganic anion transporter [Crossiella sp. SN42]|uniref:SulP family inorganic anion transporter n=1 Tax=Crossiella sp. SN42 TaxID=2944808 RepID=UPI00207D56F3|nr:SulP family inorganic anion transporter [Crossiella sp. SN42]MCO1581306.1 SulP family inorganic anion transporter [Crossiella sp. SN42]